MFVYWIETGRILEEVEVCGRKDETVESCEKLLY
jgi:hypothetical protein